MGSTAPGVPLVRSALSQLRTSDFFTKMNVRLKLANKEQNTCSNKMKESSNDQEKSEDESNDEVNKSRDETEEETEETNGDLNVEGPACKDLDEDDKDLETNSNEKPNSLSEEKVSSVVNSSENKNSDEIVEETKSLGAETTEQLDIKDKDEQKNKGEDHDKTKDKGKEEELSSSNDADDKKSNSTNSKLDAEALSASLSSSRCLLKRNRDDLDSDSDSDGDEEEPDSKKSHVVEVTPKLVSKLKSSELLASMSSSKSLLKRGIEKVDKANTDEKTDAPESKKSNLAQTPKPEDSSKTLEEVSKEIQEESPEEIKPIIEKSAAKTLKFPESPCQIDVEKPNIVQPNPIKESEVVKVSKKEEPVKIEVKQKIGAKDLAGQRQLEKKRLNKMLAIFDDQKIVK